jgi:hypothetical protein
MTRRDPATSGDGMDLQVVGDIWHWRGPAPYYFVTVPDEECAQLKATPSRSGWSWPRAEPGAHTAWQVGHQ